MEKVMEKRTFESLSENQILEILKEQDRIRGLSSTDLEYALFLTDLWSIVTQGTILVDTNTAAEILNLRAKREELDMHYDDSAIRWHKKRGNLKPLTPEELVETIGVVIKKMHWFRLEDVLKLPLGRWSRTMPRELWVNAGRKSKFEELFGRPLPDMATA